MGFSAQNSSGMHWCRRRVKFNEVPEKVLKVPENVWEALVQSQVRSGSTGFRRRFRSRSGKLWCRARSGVRFNRVPEKVPEKAWEALVRSQVMFNRVSEKVPENMWEALVQSQVRFTGFRVGGFGAEPG